jgi:hypothetical protein
MEVFPVRVNSAFRQFRLNASWSAVRGTSMTSSTTPSFIMLAWRPHTETVRYTHAATQTQKRKIAFQRPILLSSDLSAELGLAFFEAGAVRLRMQEAACQAKLGRACVSLSTLLS